MLVNFANVINEDAKLQSIGRGLEMSSILWGIPKTGRPKGIDGPKSKYGEDSGDRLWSSASVTDEKKFHNPKAGSIFMRTDQKEMNYQTASLWT